MEYWAALLNPNIMAMGGLHLGRNRQNTQRVPADVEIVELARGDQNFRLLTSRCQEHESWATFATILYWVCG